jgi:hypothetical protein
MHTSDIHRNLCVSGDSSIVGKKLETHLRAAAMDLLAIVGFRRFRRRQDYLCLDCRVWVQWSATLNLT